jgi:TPR repeat protein/energy-coupling factor transporter ATP-binding protein EcfA2
LCRQDADPCVIVQKMGDGGVRRRALVIGSQCTVLGQQHRLSFLPQLAEDLYGLLIDPGYGACAPALPDDSGGGLLLDPSAAEIHGALFEAFRRANEDGAMLLVALLGHGVLRQGDFYFLSIDATDGEADGTAVLLTPQLQGLLNKYREVDGLLVWLDACQSGIAVSEAAADWGPIALGDTRPRYEVLSAADDRAAYRGDFTRTLIETVRAGIPGAGDYIDANALRSYLQEGAKDQVPQRATIDTGTWAAHGDKGLWLAKNRSLYSAADDAASRAAHSRVADLTQHLQPTTTLDALVAAAREHRCVMLTGARGSGKSTLAAALMQPAAGHGRVPAGFAQAITFAGSTSTMDTIAGALAGQLRDSVEGFARALTEYETRLEEQERAKKPALERWVRGPLGLMKRHDVTSIRLVIDAVDELDEPTAQSLRNAVGDADPARGVQLRFVLTARPGAARPAGSHEVTVTAPGNDVIAAYMRERGVADEHVPQLVSRAAGNWLQAYLLAGEALREGFNLTALPADPSLSLLYERELLHAGAGNRDRWESMLRPVLAVVAAAGVGPVLPLQVAVAAASRLGGPASRTRFRDGVVRLSGLIVRDQPGLDQERVGVFHQSLCDDYLFRSDSGVQFPVDAAEAHGAIADALRELVPPDSSAVDDPLHRYAMLTEPEHLWASGRVNEVHESLKRPRKVRPPDERERWRLWSARFGDTLGPDHPDTLEAREKLARFTGLAGGPAEARDQYAEVMPALEELWGPTDRRTLDVKNAEAYFIGWAGDPEGAVKRYQVLVPRFERVLGSSHPDTLNAKANFARFSGELTGGAAAARDQFAQTVRTLEETVGPDHPQTLVARSNLAKFTGDAGDPESAIRQLNDVAPALEDMLGPKHPDTLLAYSNRARFVGEFNPHDARAIFHQLGPIFHDALGAEHPSTQIADFNAFYWTAIVALREIDRRPTQVARTAADKPVDDEFVTAMLLASQLLSGDNADLMRRVLFFEDTEALRQLGALLEQHGRPVEARVLYGHAATAGQRGPGPSAEREARTWQAHKTSARNGEDTAMESTIDAVRKAALRGGANAMYTFGIMLATRSNPPDLKGARYWLEKAAAGGHAEAMRNLGYLLADHTKPPDLGAARRWYEKAAVAGNTAAMYDLGLTLATRLDPPDLDAARVWWEKAAARGHVSAMYNLGYLFSDQLNPPNLTAARRWYEQAAADGHTNAMLHLGILLAARLNPPDFDGARHWYQQLAAAGHPEAKTILDLIHRHDR